METWENMENKLGKPEGKPTDHLDKPGEPRENRWKPVKDLGKTQVKPEGNAGKLRGKPWENPRET